MSEHSWTLENLAAYLADGLEPAERERLDRHAAECETCVAALADARRVDGALTGLFAATRPGPILEDRVIQSLRTRAQASRMRLPGWLAGAAAALLLIALTGSIASYLLFPGGQASTESIPNGSMAKSVHGWFLSNQAEAPKDVQQLAEESREKALEQLDDRTSLRTPDVHWREVLTPKMEGKIPDGTSNTLGLATKPLVETPQVSMGDGRIPPGGGMGMMGMGGGMGMPGWQAGSGGGMGTYNLPVNPYINLNQAGAASTYYFPTATPTGPAPTSQNGTQLGYFAPSQVAQKAADGKVDKGVAPTPKPTPNQPERVSQPLGDQGQGKGEANAKFDEKKTEKPPQEAGPRKIVIRTGEVEYEVQSFDAAVATITRLVKSIKGGFIATVNSDKLANGKVRGSVVVRVPPESLDQLILDLRTNLGKSGELKNQRISSQDITKQYTDLESRLRAARAMEERLLQIIKSGKGEIKDLLAVEKELGTWRTRIEEFEGELRYYANQVALSTLSIVLYESEIQAPYGIVERERVQMALEADDVDLAVRGAEGGARGERADHQVGTQAALGRAVQRRVAFRGVAGRRRPRARSPQATGHRGPVGGRSPGRNRGRHRQTQRRQDAP